MVRAYHRVDPLMDERKSHYSPAQFGAFLKVQLLAGRQSRRGWFRSLKALKDALPGAYVRHVDFLVAERDLTVHQDGTVYLDGWDEWQEGDLTVGDRMARLRNRRRNATVTGTVTPAVTQPSPTATRSSVGVSTSVSERSSERSTAHAPGWMIDEFMPAVLAIEQATGYPFPRGNAKLRDVVEGLIARRDVGPVIAAIPKAVKRIKAATGVTPPSADQLVYELVKVMEPYTNGTAAAAAVQGDAELEQYERERAADERQLARLRERAKT